ncbi:hypothetical protein EVAR_31052_1 [Eumeta japonica]|uniref:Uncharacterized protein n=1 Tax=Eumeta variegata TaxID=151549 RepID=A0A4C1VGC8_EUMVA|nr:hypothetical protein EVAR_31052_1 [Eumeta japonica]
MSKSLRTQLTKNKIKGQSPSQGNKKTDWRDRYLVLRTKFEMEVGEHAARYTAIGDIMSRIPQTLSKENKPGLLNRRPLGKNLTKVLSDAEKTELLANHTKPMKSIAASSVCSTRTQFKRSVTLPAPGSRITKPGVIKPEVKTISTIQRSGPNRDFMFYKTHYNELLEKHRAIKSEFTDLKDKHEEFSDEYEKIKETALNTANERDALKEKLLKSLNELKERSVEYEKLRIDCELQKHENEELIRKMKVLEDIADSFKVKKC